MKLTNEIAAETALPGHPDLTFDMAGVTLTAVVREGSGLLVHGTGGYGFCVDVNGARVVSRFGTDDKITEFDFTGHFVDAATLGVDFIYATLCRWRDTGTEIRVCCAPGRHTLAFSDPGSWVLLPGVRARSANG